MEFHDDVVYPVHDIDGSALMHDVICIILRFDGVVDSTLLKNAIETALDTGDWKKLGGRIRRRNERLEIHTPKKYTVDRPPMNWEHETHDCRIADHPQAGKFPSGDRLSISAPPANIEQLALASHFPRSIQDMLDKDVPQLSIKLVTFSNATLLATTYCHVTWDAFGFLGFMKTVQSVLEGRDIAPHLGARTDIMEELARPYMVDKSAPEVKSSSMPTTISMPQPPPSPPSPLEQRIVVIPNTVMDRLKIRLQQESSSAEVDDSVGPDNLSLALLVQQFARSDSNPAGVALINVFNARVMVPSIWRAKGIYTQNMVVMAPNVLSADVASGSPGSVIASQRDCLQKFVGKDATGAYMAGFLGRVDAKLGEIIMNAGSSTPVAVNNLTVLTRSPEIDLSQAMVPQSGAVTGSKLVGTPSLLYVSYLNISLPVPVMTVCGQVTSEAYWIAGSLPQSAWDSMQEYLKTL